MISGHETAWLPLQYWPDGTVKVAQAQFTDTLPPADKKDYTVARDEPALAGPFTRNPWVSEVATNLELGAEVQDTFYVPYRGHAAGVGTVLQSTPLVQTTMWHTYHTAVGQPGIGRDRQAVDVAGDLRQLVARGLEVGDHDAARTGLRIGARDRLSNAARSSRDDADLAFDMHVRFPPVSFS